LHNIFPTNLAAIGQGRRTPEHDVSGWALVVGTQLNAIADGTTETGAELIKSTANHLLQTSDVIGTA